MIQFAGLAHIAHLAAMHLAAVLRFFFHPDNIRRHLHSLHVNNSHGRITSAPGSQLGY
jgi:hypothetical protein